MALDYKTLILTSLQYNRRQHTQWDTNVKAYRGEVTAIRNKALPQWQHIIETNLTRPVIDSMVPSIIFGNPKIMLEPARQRVPREIAMKALEIENELNATTRTLNYGMECANSVHDAALFGVGFMKFGLSTTLGYDRDQILNGAYPFAKRVSPYDMLIDPGCREHDLSDADYVAFRSIVPLETAKKDKNLKNADKMVASFELQDVPPHIQDSSQMAKDNVDYIILYELWHRDGTFAVVDAAGNVYREQKEWPSPRLRKNGLFPVAVFSLNRVPEKFYSPGEPEYTYMLQLEASEKRTQQLNHTRRFNRKYQVHPDVPSDDIEALKKGDDGTVIRSTNPVTPIVDATLSVDVYKEYDMVWSELREVTGLSAFQRGSSEQGVYSATAARMIDAAANIRVEFLRAKVANSVARGAEILYNIIGEMADPQWPDYPFMFKTDVSTMQRPDDEGRRNQLIQFGQIAQQFPHFRVEAWLQDVALAFNKQPFTYLYSPEEMQQQQQQGDPKAAAEQAKAEAAMQTAQLQLQQAQLQLQVAQAKADAQAQQLQLKLQQSANKAQTNAQLSALKTNTAAIQAEQADAVARLVVQKEASGTNLAAVKAEEADAKARLNVTAGAAKTRSAVAQSKGRGK